MDRLESDSPDNVLIERTLAGEKAALAILIKRYYDPLHRHVLHMTGSPDLTDDVMMVTFIKAHRHLAQLRGHFGLWVFRTAADVYRNWPSSKFQF